ncbi:MAG: metallopeptidase family protein [Candidatus Omnitrophota bacterium]
MTYKEFEDLAIEALKGLPEEFKNELQNVDVVIEDEPDMDAARKLGLGTRGRLLGLYQGVPLKDRTHYYGMVMPDKITLYKKNIELACRIQGVDVRDEVRHVVQHEIAHHFGISDERLKDLDIY